MIHWIDEAKQQLALIQFFNQQIRLREKKLLKESSKKVRQVVQVQKSLFKERRYNKTTRIKQASYYLTITQKLTTLRKLNHLFNLKTLLNLMMRLE